MGQSVSDNVGSGHVVVSGESGWSWPERNTQGWSWPDCKKWKGGPLPC